MPVYPDRKNSVKPDAEKSSPNQSPEPQKAAVARPRYFTKSPTEALAEMVVDPNCPLKAFDVLVVGLLASCSHKLQGGGRGLAFPGQQSLAKRIGKSRHTVMRSIKRIIASDLVIPYKVRMAKGRDDGGQWARLYYDMAPYWQLCGEDVQPRSRAEVEKYLDAAGYWRRGMRLERDLSSNSAKSPKSDGHRVANLHVEGEGDALVDGDSTVSQKCDSNNIEHPDVVKQDKYNAGSKALRDVDALSGDQQVVYCRLKEIGYGHSKAIADLRKYGAPYVEARIDFVLRDARGVKDVRCMINHWMSTPLTEAYRPGRRSGAGAAIRSGASSAPVDVDDLPGLPPVPMSVNIKAARTNFVALPQYEQLAISDAGKAEARRQHPTLDELSTSKRDVYLQRYILLEFLRRSDDTVSEVQEEEAPVSEVQDDWDDIILDY